MNRTVFFDHVRAAPFGGSMTQGQVDGLNQLLDVWEQYCDDDPLDLLSYDLGTAFLETGGTMRPIKERGQRSYFDKYAPGTRRGKILGNTKPGDGYRFRGEGHVQNTGRSNAGRATLRLNELFGLGIDLEKKPSQRGDPLISALSLFIGNKEGWWTGHNLLDYLDGIDESDAEDFAEFENARRVVNGTDRAADIAGFALAFAHALRAAVAVPVGQPDDPGDAPDQSLADQPAQSGFSFARMLVWAVRFAALGVLGGALIWLALNGGF